MNKKSILLQIIMCLGFFTVFWDAALFSEYTVKTNMGLNYLKTFVINFAFFSLVFYFIYIYRERICSFEYWQFIKKNGFLLIFLLIFILSLFSILDIWLMGDGAIYYSQIKINRNWNMESIFDLKMVGHQTCLYTMWLLIGEYILPNNAIGVRLVLIFLATVTVVMYYKILRKMYINTNIINIVLFVSIFAFHPGFWGILGEINTDFPVLCFFIWVIYFQLSKQYIMMFFSAMSLCLSKETGVMIFAFYVLGCFLAKVIFLKKKNLLNILKLFLRRDMLVMCLSCLLWLIIYLVFENGKVWSGASGSAVSVGAQIAGMKLDTFGRYSEYAIHKVKEIFVLNNAYILWGFVVLGIVIKILGKRKNARLKGNEDIIIGIYVAFLIFLNFSLYFVTWPNYRYLLPMLFFMTFFASFFLLGYIKNKYIQRTVLAIVLSLTVFSNFSADVISKENFNTVSMGNGEMVSTNLFYISDFDNKILNINSEVTYEYAYDDEGIYNREYSNRGKCINKILNKIKYDSDTLLVFPYISGSKSFYYGRKERFEFDFEKYVNLKTYKLNLNILDFEYPYAENWIKFNDLYLEGDEVVSQEMLSQYDRVYYVYPVITGKNKIDVAKQIGMLDIKSDFKVTRSTTCFEVLQLK